MLSIKTNLGPLNSFYFTVNEDVRLTVTVDFSATSNTELERRYRLDIYNGRQSSIYSTYISYGVYWRSTVFISRGHYLDAGVYEVILYDIYSQEFRRQCPSYYNFIRSSPFEIYSLVLEKQYMQLYYYGKCYTI